MSSSCVMSMRRRNAGIALQDSIAAADVLPTPIIFTAAFWMQKKRIECAIMLKAALADIEEKENDKDEE